MKKLYKISVISILVLFAYSCTKVKYNEDEVKLHVTVENPFDLSSPSKDYTNKMVFLRKKGEEKYQYSAKTDQDGYVKFSLLEMDVAYEVFVKDTIDGLPFTGTSPEIKSSNRELILMAIKPDKSKFNGFRIKCVDSQGAGVPGVNVCLFESQTLANTANCEVSTYSGSSNQQGFYMLTKIPARNYFISIVDTVANIPISYQGSIEVLDKDLTEIEINVIP